MNAASRARPAEANTEPQAAEIAASGPPRLEPPPGRWFAAPVSLLAAPISDFAFRLYCALLHYAGPEGTAWPGVDRLARDTGKSERQVRRALLELRDAELLDCHHRGLGRTNVYQLRALPPVGRPDKTVRSRRDKNDRYGADMDDRYGADMDDRLTRTKELEPVEQHTPPVVEEAAPAVCVQVLKQAGLSAPVAKRLVERYGVPACEMQLDWLPRRAARDPAATLRRAIEESWLPPEAGPKVRLPGERPYVPLAPPPRPVIDEAKSDAAREEVKAKLAAKGLAGQLAKIGGGRVGA